MDELKNYIADNKDLFDSNEPSVGHFDKFSELLSEQKQTKVIKWQWTRLLKVASVAILVVLSGLYVSEKLFYMGKNMQGYANPEYKEAKEFYIMQVDNKIGSIQSLDYLMDDEQKEMLKTELEEMDIVYNELNKDLKNMPDDQRVIDAMIKHYKMKSEVLSRILNDLERVKHKNTKQNESVQI